MSTRLSHLPLSLMRQSRFERLGGPRVPALLAHPDWETPAPTVLWLHGRTVYKELDPGRYLRWIRAGIAACAIDLPGHGERAEPRLQGPDATLYVMDQCLGEIDQIIEALADPEYGGVFDLDRLAIGGVSLGGMVTLRRLGDRHPFKAALAESTAGDFSKMSYLDHFERELVERLDPVRRLDQWSATPLLALHSEADEWVPVEAIRSFIAALNKRFPEESPGALRTWPTTGAPYEHSGFGRVSNDAKNLELEHLKRVFFAHADST